MKPLAPENTPSVDNVLRTYRQATPEQIADGMTWYGEAHSLAVALDPTNVERSAGVISALSPQLIWERNAALAIRAYGDGQASGCLPDSIRKANAILNGADVATTLNGAKTVAFAQVIADPTDYCAVVIDRHAFDIAVGGVTDQKRRGTLGRKGVYDLFADAYREAAHRVGISPSQMQAVTWVVWRETSIRTSASVRRTAGRTDQTDRSAA